MRACRLIAALILSALLPAVATHADNSDRHTTFATEVQFNPFNGKHTFELDALKLRCYLGKRHVVAATVGFGINSHKNVADTGFKYRWNSHRNGSLRINAGYEFIYFSRKRVQLYAGARAGYERVFASSTQSFDKDRRVVYANYDEIDDVGAADIINLAAVTGIDFYVYRGLYLGVELGIYFSDSLPCEQIRKTYSEGNYSESRRKIGGHDLTIKTAASPLLRLGWKF